MKYTHTIHTPQPLPEFYKTWTKEWIEWIENANTHLVQIHRELAMPAPTSSDPYYKDPGYEVLCDIPVAFEKQIKKIEQTLEAILSHLGLEARSDPCNTCHETGYFQDGGECFECGGSGEIVYVQ